MQKLLQKLLKNDLIWRPVAAAVIVAITIFAHSALNRYAESKTFKPLREITDQLVASASDWLHTETAFVESLASDARLREAFAAEKWEDSIMQVRRTLYEFSYLNEIEFAYVANPSATPAVVHTGGAPSLPSQLFEVMLAGGQSASSLLVQVGGQPYILVVTRMTDGEGMVGMLEPVAAALQRFNVPTSSKPLDWQFGIYRERGDGQIASIMNIARPEVMVLPASFSLPIASDVAAEGEYFLNGSEKVAVVRPVPGYAGWRVSTVVDASVLAGQINVAKWALRLVALLAILMLFVLPGKGVYADTLRKYKLLPALLDYKVSKGQQAVFENSLAGALAMTGLEKLDDSVLSERKAAREHFSKTQDMVRKEYVVYTTKRERSEGEIDPDEKLMIRLIERAIAQDSIKLLYQPMFDTETNRPRAFEVFLRILDEDGESVSPGKFMPVAEKHKLVSKLDEVVIANVCKTYFNGKDSQELPAPLSINLSGNSFEGLEYLEKLMAGVDEGKIDPQKIMFELRSREILRDRRAMSFIRKCHDKGFKFAMDYFGGGAQIMKAAKVLRFDYCKLDAFRFKEFVQNRDMQKELVTVALAAKQNGIALIMERVESKPLEKFARKLGFKMVQGYGLAEPAETFVIAPIAKAALAPQAEEATAEATAPVAPAAEGADQSALPA